VPASPSFFLLRRGRRLVLCGDKLDESMSKYQRTQQDMDRVDQQSRELRSACAQLGVPLFSARNQGHKRPDLKCGRASRHPLTLSQIFSGRSRITRFSFARDAGFAHKGLSNR
jgi:hypothetical protein